MRYRLLAVALAGAAAVTLSGCFVFAGIRFSDLKLKPGEKTVATVFTHPSSNEPSGTITSPSHRDYVFFFIGVPADGSLKLLGRGRKFDVKEKFGNHPRRLINDDQLRDYFVNQGNCGSFDTDSNHTYRVVRTENEVFDRRKPQTPAVSKLPFRQVSGLDPDFFHQGIVVIAAGWWNDDGDGVLESSDDSFGCEGGAESWLYMKSAAAKVNKDGARQNARQYNLDG